MQYRSSVITYKTQDGFPKRKINEVRRFDVSRLRCTGGVEVEETRFRKQEYVGEVLERAREGWPWKLDSSGEVESDEGSTGRYCFRDPGSS